MKVTVLMPIYNAEKYICEAIDSLLAQTSPNWRLICIDDGSTDSSASIVESYCAKDERIKLIRQVNAGPAVARAKAIEITDTEYVSILDADDAYATNYVELMLKRAAETDADSIVPDVEVEYGNTKKEPTIFTQHNLCPNRTIDNGQEAFGMTIPWQLHGWQMIRTSLAKKYYTVDLASYSNFNSDEYITRLLYLKSNKVALCSAQYRYRISPNSITRKPSLKKFDYLKTLDKLVDLCYQERIDKKIMLRLYNDYYVTLISMLKLTKELNLNEAKIGQKAVRNAYLYSYRAKFPYFIYSITPIKTILKFMLSLIDFNIIKVIAK